ARRLLCSGPHRAARAVFGDGAAPRLACGAFFLVDDRNAAPLPRRNPLPPPVAALATAVRRRFARRRHDARGELRRPAFRGELSMADSGNWAFPDALQPSPQE